jgi:hypothetical protein
MWRSEFGYNETNPGFDNEWLVYASYNNVVIYDPVYHVELVVQMRNILNPFFDLKNWYKTRICPYCNWCGGLTHRELRHSTEACDCSQEDVMDNVDLNELFALERTRRIVGRYLDEDVYADMPPLNNIIDVPTSDEEAPATVEPVRLTMEDIARLELMIALLIASFQGHQPLLRVNMARV